jgi:hypothetical protein
MNDKNLKQFKNLLRFSGIFNIVSAFLLIFPVVYEYYLLFFNDINSALGLGGQPVSIPSNPLNALLINTAGIDLVLIGAIVLVVSKNPMRNRTIILLNGIGRLLGHLSKPRRILRVTEGLGKIHSREGMEHGKQASAGSV